MNRRSIVLLFVFIWTFIITGGRLAYIALGENYLAAAENQALYTLTVDTPRGTVFDRNGSCVTNRQQIYKIAVTATPQVISAIHTVFSGAQKKTILEQLSGRKPFVITAETLFSAQGAYAFPCYDTAPFYQPAIHLTGYLDTAGQKGMAGLQKAFDALLCCDRPTTITYACDATGGALTGVEPTVTQNTMAVATGVITTLDIAVQLAVEQAFPSLKKGAVVVQKAGSGEILASLSAPDYSPEDIEGAMENPDLPLLNRALTAYNVGSVFKLCVAAAALEQNIPVDRSYTCTGTILCGTTFHCHEEKGHGSLSMDQALAVSCNTYFIDLAREIGGEALYQMAVKMGLGRSVTLCDEITSDSGRLPSLQELMRSPAELANFAIGQGVFLATPLQIAAMTNAVANGGIYFTPDLIMGTIDKTGTAVYEKAASGTRIFSRETADTLMKMMQLVVTDGTGIAGAFSGTTAGGKTATAQTGMVDSQGAPVTQAWFTGYFPAENPAYIVTVLVEEGSSGGSDAAPVFRDICEEIMKGNTNLP